MPVNTAAPEAADITLASTSETQAELDHATGPNWRQPFEKPADPAAGENKETPAGEQKDDSTKTKPAPGTGAPQKKPGAAGENDADDDLPKGARKRIDRLTRRLGDAEAELERLRNSGTQPKTTPAPKSAAEQDAEPQQKDFPSWEKFNEAHSRWAVRDEQRKQSAREAQESEQQRVKDNYDSHLQRIEKARNSHDDFDDAVKDAGTFDFASPAANQAFQLAIIEADNGPDVLYHLAKHPEEMAKFADLSPVRTQLLVGRISAALSPDSSAAAAKPAAGAPKPGATSRTPAPTTPVRRPTTAAGSNYRDPETAKGMSDEDWIKAREADLRSRKQRRN